MAEAWYKFEAESSKQYEAFQAYLELGFDRSIRKAANKLSAPDNASAEKVRRYELWSSDNEWVRRAAEYDAWKLNKRRCRMENEALAMAERHVEMAITIQDEVISKLIEFNHKNLTNADIIKWFEIAVKIERLSRGQPTEKIIQENTGTLNIMQQISEMTDEQLRQEIERHKHTIKE